MRQNRPEPLRPRGCEGRQDLSLTAGGREAGVVRPLAHALGQQARSLPRSLAWLPARAGVAQVSQWKAVLQ